MYVADAGAGVGAEVGAGAGLGAGVGLGAGAGLGVDPGAGVGAGALLKPLQAAWEAGLRVFREGVSRSHDGVL